MKHLIIALMVLGLSVPALAADTWDCPKGSKHLTLQLDDGFKQRYCVDDYSTIKIITGLPEIMKVTERCVEQTDKCLQGYELCLNLMEKKDTRNHRNYPDPEPEGYHCPDYTDIDKDGIPKMKRCR
jgi:hypothetical protein